MTYPSATFPGRPARRLELPEGRKAVPAVGDAAGAALVAMRPATANFRAESVKVKVDVGAAIGIGGGR